jgi:hypothetical protein
MSFSGGKQIEKKIEKETDNFIKETISGKKILKNNQFFQDFTSLMRCQEFLNFYDNYFNDWSNIQTMVFYMKIYSAIEDLYYNQYNKRINDELMTYTLHKIITTTETRKAAIELFKNFKGEDVDSSKLITFKSMINFNSYSQNIKLIK